MSGKVGKGQLGCQGVGPSVVKENIHIYTYVYIYIKNNLY